MYTGSGCSCRWCTMANEVANEVANAGASGGLLSAHARGSLSTNLPSLLPVSAHDRKQIPIATGVLDYFPAALAEVAKVSFAGNQQHNPGQPLHWARGKSTDQDDTIIRHFLERGGLDSDGQRHSAKLAWRALALLQLELEAAGAPVARGAVLPEAKK